jgi:hypothetical protein
MSSGSMSRAECLGGELTPSRVRRRAMVRKILNSGLPCGDKFTNLISSAGLASRAGRPCALMWGTAHYDCCATPPARSWAEMLLRNRALLATPLSEGVMRPEYPASAVVASTAGTDSYTLRRAIARFLTVCKAEHLPPTEILVRFDAFLVKYNARQRRFLRWPTDTERACSARRAESGDIEPSALALSRSHLLISPTTASPEARGKPRAHRDQRTT